MANDHRTSFYLTRPRSLQSTCPRYPFQTRLCSGTSSRQRCSLQSTCPRYPCPFQTQRGLVWSSGTYSEVSGYCLTCPTLSSSPQGATSVDDCVCSTELRINSITTINSIVIYWDKYIYKIVFGTSSGTITYGNSGGTPVSFNLNPDEYIVSATYKPFIASFGPYLGCGIAFRTSQGRTLEKKGTFYDVASDCGAEQTFTTSGWKVATGLTQASSNPSSDVTGFITADQKECVVCNLVGSVQGCTCAAGRTAVNNECVLCPAGTYKTAAGGCFLKVLVCLA